MKLGAMNNPMIDVYEEISMISDLGFEFIDLTLEPSETASHVIDADKVANTIEEAGLFGVGHTAWYLPVASPYPEIREAAIREMEECLRKCRDMGFEKMNMHPNLKIPLHEEAWIIGQNIDALARLTDLGQEIGMTMMMENMPHFSRVAQLKPILEAVPGAEFLLDIGHANLDTPYNRSEELLANFGHRLGHVHVSDNRGGTSDEHLPLGVGTINWLRKMRLLKTLGYDGTITIEVFGDDDEYLVVSRNKLRKLWDLAEPGDEFMEPIVRTRLGERPA